LFTAPSPLTVTADTRAFRGHFLSLWGAVLILLIPAWLHGQSPQAEGDALVWMDARHGANVRYHPRHNSSLVAKIAPGSTLGVYRTSFRNGCPSHWYARPSRGYICGNELRPSAYDRAQPGPSALPDIRKDTTAWILGRGGGRLYQGHRAVARREMLKRLFIHSILTIRDTATRYGTPWLINRSHQWISAENAISLPPVSTALSLAVPHGEEAPAGMIIAADTPVHTAPASDAPVAATLPRWSWVYTGDRTLLQAQDDWVHLPGQGYVRDAHIARRQPVPAAYDPDPRPDEKWISVDLTEQVLVAWQGRRIVRISPCSTGIKDNTPTGSFRVQWKRRIQTMNARGGHEIVEDVQWVMYYYKRRGIAIHAAYWHDRFGERYSHGCVNLPEQDARWLYDWSDPPSDPEDAETFPVPQDAGTRVIVF
jgi:lipoprotein-anchoring transpeptidase ErfK/SrfK